MVNRVVRAIVLMAALGSASVLTYFGQLSGEVYAGVVMAVLGLFHRGVEDNDGKV